MSITSFFIFFFYLSGFIRVDRNGSLRNGPVRALGNVDVQIMTC